MNVDAWIMNRRFRTTWSPSPSPSPHHCHLSCHRHIHFSPTLLSHANLWWVSCEISVCEYVMLSLLTHTPFKFIIQIFIVHFPWCRPVRSGCQYTKCKSIRIYIFRNTDTHTRTLIYMVSLILSDGYAWNACLCWYLVYMHTIRYDTICYIWSIYTYKNGTPLSDMILLNESKVVFYDFSFPSTFPFSLLRRLLTHPIPFFSFAFARSGHYNFRFVPFCSIHSICSGADTQIRYAFMRHIRITCQINWQK